jgi:hypothetical protein
MTLSIMAVIVGLWATMLKYELASVQTAAQSTAETEHKSPFATFKSMIQNAKQTANVLQSTTTYKRSASDPQQGLVPLQVVSSPSVSDSSAQ